MTDAYLFLLIVTAILIADWFTNHSVLVSLSIAALAAAFIWRRDRQR